MIIIYLFNLFLGTLPQHQLLATMKLTLLTALFLQKMTLTVKYMATTRTLMASQPTKLAVSVVRNPDIILEFFDNALFESHFCWWMVSSKVSYLRVAVTSVVIVFVILFSEKLSTKKKVEVWEKACHPIWFPPLLLRIPQPLDLLLTGRRHLHPVLIQQIARMMNNSSLRTRRRRHAKNGLRVLRKTRAHSPRTIRKSKSCAKRNGKENTYLNIVRKHVLKSVRVPVPRETDPYNQCHGLSVSAVWQII